MAGDLDRLHAELDRQLGEVRAASDGLATRSGLLVAAVSAVALLLGPRIDPSRHVGLLVATFLVIGLSIAAAGITIVPSLKVGPDRAWLAAWEAREPSWEESRKLYSAKTAILGANLDRFLIMRVWFAIQGITTIAAVALALWYTALK